jgi:hypothetical protein
MLEETFLVVGVAGAPCGALGNSKSGRFRFGIGMGEAG